MQNYEKESLKVYRKEIETYPLLTEEETKELLVDFKERGDREAFEKLVKHNLRLAYSQAFKYKDACRSMTLLDLIQESNIIMMKAIELYDINRGVKLSTYITSSIDQSLKREINNKDETIRIPVYLKEGFYKYRKFTSKYFEKYGKNPMIAEIKAATGLRESEIKTIEELEKFKTTSLNKKIANDNKKTELEQLFADGKDSYNDIEKDYDEIILLQTLKDFLSYRDYYIVYYIVIHQPHKSLEEISKDLNITKERVRQLEKQALEKIKPTLSKMQTKTIRKHTIKSLKKSSLIPLPPLLKSNLFFLKQNLSDIEYYIIYTKIFECLNDDFSYYQVKFPKSNPDTIIKKIKYCDTVIQKAFRKSNLDKVYEFYKKKYTIPQILEFDIEPIQEIEYKELIEFSKNISFEEIEQTNSYQNLDKNTKRLLKRYYEKPQCRKGKSPSFYKENIEKEVNLQLLGYITNDSFKITKEEIEELTEKYKYLLTTQEIEAINNMFVKTKRINPYQEQDNYLKDKIYQLKYGVYHFFDHHITEKQIRIVEQQKPNILSADEKYLINEYYGINTTRKSYKELEKELNIPSVLIHDKVALLRERILINYFNLEQSNLDISKEKLLEYLSDPRYEFSKDTKICLRLYLEEKSYKEISEITGFNQIQVSNFITESIRKANLYRYGVRKNFLPTEEELEDICSQINYTSEEKKIVSMKYISNLQLKDIAKEMNIPLPIVKKITTLAYITYLKSKIPQISKEDYELELIYHSSDSILTSKEKELIIKEKYFENCKTPDTNQKISQKLLFQKEQIDTKIRERLLKIKTPEYGIISQKESILALKNPNIPLTQREKVILSHLKGINGYEFLSAKDLAKKYNMSVSSLKRRYERIILLIFQHQNTKKSSYSYEKDIIPIMKYFCKIDKRLIELKYGKKLTNKEIAEKLSLTIHKINIAIKNLKISIAAIIENDETARKFDFDYARDVIEREDLPLSGDKKLKGEIYKLYFGENDIKKYSLTEIKDKLNLSFSEAAIKTAAYSVMIAVKKYEQGQRDNLFSLNYTDILNFYNKNKDHLPTYKRLTYERYLNRKVTLNSNDSIPSSIIFDIIKSSGKQIFKLDETSKESIKKILINNEYHLSNRVRNLIKEFYEISEKELMSGKEKNKVIKSLNCIYKEYIKNSAAKEKIYIKRHI